MDIDPIQTELRRKNREDRHGEGAICVLCGEAALETLVQVPIRLIERHHPMGQNHEPDITVPLCRNCHAKLHEETAQEGADLGPQPTFLERLLQMLRALAVFFRMLGDALSMWAKKLADLIEQFDEQGVEWQVISVG